MTMPGLSCLRVLMVHPLPVQPDAKLVHIHGGLEARYLGCLLWRHGIGKLVLCDRVWRRVRECLI
jgi:hypothetical protein